MKDTIKNLAAAFIGESQARNRYTMYASAARKEGFEQISAIFAETADQEKEHAKQLMKMIQTLKEEAGGDNEENNPVMVAEAEVPTTVGTTADNLKAAIAGENHEHSSMYPEFAAEAEKAGLMEVANRLRAIAKAEAHHEERYKKLLKEVEAGTVFKKEEETAWICRECGYEHVGKEAPTECPSCAHPQAFYQVKCETY